MTQKRRRKSSLSVTVGNTLEIIHIGNAIAPGIAVIVAAIFRKDINLYIELTCAFSALLINVFILLKPKTAESKKGKGLSLFYTFIFNRIKPVKKPTEQKYDVKVSVVEGKNTAYFKRNLDERFHKAQRHLAKDEIDEHLKFECVLVKPCKPEEAESESNKFPTEHEFALKNANAVVVVRTDELEENSWAYDAIDTWAYENSEVPILFAKNEDKNYTHEIADNYLRIPDDPKSLPWRLLQRAGERGKAWRIQAGYNRAMVWNIFYLALMGLAVLIIWSNAQRSALQVAYKGQSQAMETKRLFERDILKRSDDQLNVSYWFSHKRKPEVFVTTESLDTKKSYSPTNSSLIGCGFSTPGIITECKEGCNDEAKQADVFASWGTQRTDLTCYMSPRIEEPIYSIACITYRPSGATGDEYTVGICIFTGNPKQSILEGDYHKFLEEQVVNFERNFHAELQNKTITPLSERD